MRRLLPLAMICSCFILDFSVIRESVVGWIINAAITVIVADLMLYIILGNLIIFIKEMWNNNWKE